jgi:acetylornithine deacetylase/succinyl-diaminopimelate desuccinylase-like protein
MSCTVGHYMSENRDRHLEELFELLRIPSVSTGDSNTKDVARAAGWVRDRLKAAGCTKVEVIETKRHPIVYGEWMGAPGKPTILAYGHYDVQPVDPIEKWHTPPFEPTIRDGRIYARGSSDDKGQLIIHVNALEAHLKTHGTCPVNMKFLIEGEEEIGSPNLDPFLTANRKRLACDAVVVSDTAMFDRGVPSICYGLRGLAYLQIDVTGTSGDLHSGSFGGAVVNPANALVTMLASLKDARGKVKIPGFYDDVRKLTAAERKAFAGLPHKDTRFRRQIGAPELFGEKGFTTLERLWARPSLDINGIWSGFTGEGAKTVIPATAHAKISMRLVPDQSPRDIARKVSRHLKAIAPKSVRVKVADLHGGDSWLADTGHPALRAAGKAMERAFGKPAVFVREGGSIPIVSTFGKVLKAPCVLMGIGLNDDNLHAPNEKLELDNFHRGNEAAAFLLEELGSMDFSKRTGGKAGGRSKR